MHALKDELSNVPIQIEIELGRKMMIENTQFEYVEHGRQAQTILPAGQLSGRTEAQQAGRFALRVSGFFTILAQPIGNAFEVNHSEIMVTTT